MELLESCYSFVEMHLLIITSWLGKAKLNVSCLCFPQFRTDIARTEYLSNADERLRWQASSLPADDLCTENAIMLKRFNRYFVLRGEVFKQHSCSRQSLHLLNHSSSFKALFHWGVNL